MSVRASSSTSSSVLRVSRSRTCSSLGKRRRGLMELRVSGRSAAGPAWRLRERWARFDPGEAVCSASSSVSSWKRRKIFLPRLRMKS